MGRIDAAIATIAKRQGGHISRPQLHRLGLSKEAIRHRIRRGLLIAVFREVYAVGHLPTNPIDRAHGALLAVGPGSALSHRSAASVWGIYRDWRLPFELTSPVDRRPSGLIVHLSTSLTDADLTTELGLRVVTPALTLLQIAPELTHRRLTRAVNDLRLRNRLTVGQLIDVLQRFPRHPGAKRLKLIVGASDDEPTRSVLEDDFPPFARTYDLPHYAMNRRVGGYRVDVLFAAERLILEIDGWDYHSSREAFERDRRQDADILERAGIPTVRTTWRRIKLEAAREAARLHVILARRRKELQAA